MNVIIKPLISEKSMNNVGKNKYTFVVARNAKKQAVKKAVEKMFNVHVIGVETSVIKGKVFRTGTRRVEKRRTPMKKAVVHIKTGEKIGLFEAVV